MTTDHPNGISRPTDAELARIAAELRALGEPELDDDGDAIAALCTHELAVPTAFALAYPPTHAEGPLGLCALPPLAELDRARVWRQVLARRSDATKHASPRPPSWRATWVAVATAAGLALVPMLSPGPARESTPAARATAEALRIEARAALEGVAGEEDGARATELAAQYSARLADNDGRPEAAR